MTQPGVSVVVLSHARPEKLSAALASVMAQTLAPDEVIVVDNRSALSTRVRGVVEVAGARLVALPDNAGFTGGMNAGLRLARGELVLLTEDDIVLEPDCLAHLVACQLAHPNVGLVAPLIVSLERRTVWCAGGLVELGGVYRHHFDDRGAAAPSHSNAYATSYLSGAVLLARTNLLRRLGGYRQDFFMYSEDADLCFRVLNAEYSLMVEPSARCAHFDPPAGNVASGLEFHKHKNLICLYLLYARPVVMPVFVVRYGLMALMRRRADVPRHLLLRAWLWALSRAPRLIAERTGMRRLPPLVNA